LAVIAGGATGVGVNVLFDTGLRAPASPGSIIAVYAQTARDSYVGVTLAVAASAAVTFAVAAFLLKLDKSDDEGDLAAATAKMEQHKGKKSSVASALTGAGAGTGAIHSIVFACDAGMGSSAMGASVLRKKVQAAGFSDVSVTNKAISNLRDDVDLVVSHQDLTDRARQRSGSALHVSVDNFMQSPAYDEIVDLLRQRNGAGGAPTPASAEEEGALGGALLARESIVLDGTARTRDDAITEAGRLLVAAGAAEPAYVEAMHEREASVSTFMGNGLAIPHGTNEAKSSVHRTAISLVRYSDGLDWKGKQVRFVVGIAAVGKDHLKLLGRIAEVFLDDDQVARLERASTTDEVLEVLGQVQPA
ncbi:PTS sugar transporter subunit IIA, partial [Nocardioides kribbensis]|uniref:PTS sugar transporter subunit IIA n=1 Tax=Nocardioides kribbensis TaxID=305517 RepID=UPI0032D9BC2D